MREVLGEGFPDRRGRVPGPDSPPTPVCPSAAAPGLGSRLTGLGLRLLTFELGVAPALPPSAILCEDRAPGSGAEQNIPVFIFCKET